MISSLMDNNFLGSVKIHGNPLFFLVMNRNILLNNISQWELLFPKHFNVYENVRRRLGQLKCQKLQTPLPSKSKEVNSLEMLAISIVFSSRDSGLIISFHIEIVSTRPPRKNYNWSDLWKLYQVVPWETNGKLQLWRAVVRRPLAGSRRQTVEVEAAGSPSPFARRKVIREACQGGGSALFVQRGQWSVFSLGFYVISTI